MSSTISANVDGKTATKLKMVASMENRSVSNAVSSATIVFVGLPKGVRDFLLELNAQNDQETIIRLGREMMAAAARVRLEKAATDLADASTLETQVVDTTSSGQRTLHALRYRIGNTDLIVAHPFDVMQWIRLGYDSVPDTLWDAIHRSGKELGL